MIKSSLALVFASTILLCGGCRDTKQSASVTTAGPTEVPTSPSLKAPVLTGRVEALVFNGSSEIVTSHSDFKLRIWDVDSGTLKREFPLKGVKMESTVKLGPGLIAAIYEGQSLNIWDVRKNRLNRSISAGAPISAVSFSKDGSRIAVASGIWDEVDTNSVKVYDISSGKMQRTFSTGKGQMQFVDFSPRESHLVATGISGIQVWDWKSGRNVSRVPLEQQILLSGAQYSPSGQRIVSWHLGKVTVFNDWLVPQGKPLRLTREEWGEQIQTVALAPDDSSLVSSAAPLTSTDREYPTDVKVWDIKTGKLKATLDGAGTASYLSYSPDGRYIATGGARGNISGDDLLPGQVCLFETETGKKKWCSVENAPYKK